MLSLFQGLPPNAAAQLVAQIVILRNAGIACLVIAVLSVLLRTYVRTRILKAFWWDDGIMIVCLVSHQSATIGRVANECQTSFIVQTTLIAFTIGWVPLDNLTDKELTLVSVYALVLMR